MFETEEEITPHRKIQHYAKGETVKPNKTKKKKQTKTNKQPVKKPTNTEEICEICGVTSNTMKRHYRTVHAGNSVPCEVCGQVFQSEFRLKDHMRGVHNKARMVVAHVQKINKQLSFFSNRFFF